MAKNKHRNRLSKILLYANLLPLCLSCAYFALLLGLTGTVYMKSQTLSLSVLLPVVLVVVAYTLGLWTFYPKSRREKSIKSQAKKGVPRAVQDETMIE